MKYIIKDKNLVLLFITSFLFFINESLLLPTLPLYLSDLNYSNVDLGMVLGAFALGVFAFRPFAGRLTDRKSRKLSLYVGLMIFTVTPVFYFFSTSFWYLLAIRFVHGTGLSFFTTSYPTMVSDIAPEDRRGEVLGHMSIASNLAFAMGPLLGFSIYAKFGIDYLLYTCVITGVIPLFVCFFINDTFTRSIKEKTLPFLKILFQRTLFISSAIVLTQAIIIGGIMAFLPVMLKNDLNLNVGLYFTMNSVAVVVFRYFVSNLSDRFGRGPVFFYSFLMILASVVVIAHIDSTPMMILAAVMNGLGSAGCVPSLMAYMADSFDQEVRGSAFSIFYGAFDVGVLSAGVLLGIVADFMGLRNMFLFTVVFGAVGIVFFTLLIRPGIRQSINWTLQGGPR
jgi:MFS family permease